eukprot:g6208.t1
MAENKLQEVKTFASQHDWRRVLKICVQKQNCNGLAFQGYGALAAINLRDDVRAIQLADKVANANPPCVDAEVLANVRRVYSVKRMNDRTITMYKRSIASFSGTTTVSFDENVYPSTEKMQASPLERLLRGLFDTYGEQLKHKEQQKTALKLYKLTKKKTYMSWAATCLLLQNGNGTTKKLATSMLSRVIDLSDTSGQGGDGEAIRLYCDLLRELGESEKVLEVIESPIVQTNFDQPSPVVDGALAGAFTKREVKVLKCQILADMKKWREAVDSNKRFLLEIDGNEYSAVEGYINAIEELSQTDDTAIAEAETFINELQSKNKDLRAPYLLEIALARKQILSKDFTPEKLLIAASKDYLNLVLKYWKRFGRKLCCFFDLHHFLDILIVSVDLNGKAKDDEELNNAIDCILQSFDTAIQSTSRSSTSTDATNLKLKEKQNNLHSHICAIQISRFVGFHRIASDEDLISIVQHLVREWQNTLVLNSNTNSSSNGDVNKKNEGSGNRISETLNLLSINKKEKNEKEKSNLDQREVQHGDDLLLIAAHVLQELSERYQSQSSKIADLHQRSSLQRKSWSTIVEAIVLIEWGLKHSSYNFQMKLILIELYNSLACFGPAYERFRELQVKYIQVETLSYLVLDDAVACGFHEHAQEMCEDILDFHSSTCDHYIAKYMIVAFKYGNLCQVREFAKLRTKLNQSNQLVSSRSYLILIELMKQSKSPYTWLQQQMIRGFLQAPSMAEMSSLLETQDRQIVTKWNAPLDFESAKSEAVHVRGAATPPIEEMVAIQLRFHALLPMLLLSAFEGNTSDLRRKIEESRNLLKKIKLGVFEMDCRALCIDAFEVALHLIGKQDDNFLTIANDKLLDIASRLKKLVVKNENEIDWNFPSWDVVPHGESVPVANKAIRNCWTMVMSVGLWLLLLFPLYLKMLPSSTGGGGGGKQKKSGRKGKKKGKGKRKGGRGCLGLEKAIASLQEIFEAMVKQTKIANTRMGKGFSTDFHKIGLEEITITCKNNDEKEKLKAVRQYVLKKVATGQKQALIRLLKMGLDYGTLIKKIK